MSTTQIEAPTPERIAAFQALVSRVQIRDVQLVKSMCVADPTFVLTRGASHPQPEYSLDLSAEGRLLDDISVLVCLVDIEWVAFPSGGDEELLRIEHRFMVTFSLGDGAAPSDETIDDFARHNATFHAWPFAREAIRAASAKMGVPPAMLPLLKPD